MSDVFSKSKRSEVMARIRGRGNKATEIKFLELLRRHRISGWRRHLPIALPAPLLKVQKHSNRLPRVKPDFVFRELRVAVFIDGCFWHGCPLHGTKPQSNSEFWQSKLANNRRRDRFVTKGLQRRKWTVLRIWEHQLHDGDRIVGRLKSGLSRSVVPE
jgi:DNA mismatch endonuclease, patch repair protein